jgi:glycosyltransferase involved in cell wall biosynthesis
MIYDFKHLRPAANYPTYPPYHTGLYLEEYFYNFYKKRKHEFDLTGYTYIPVFWTNVYNTGINRHLLQPFLNALPAGKYFTVSQHDDAVTESLPNKTLSFEAGGNRSGIPIPLICSPLPANSNTQSYRDILCSFVGSINPGSLREEMYNILKDDKEIYLSPQKWVHSVDKVRFEEFVDITNRSKFTICPRGYGAQSFRLYETIQLGSIPVIIYDKCWFPFDNIIDWNKFCVLVHESEIRDIKSKINTISDSDRLQMQERGKEVYSNYFTLESVCNNILRILQYENTN